MNSEKVLQEFEGLTNEQAYVNIFSKRMMKPIPNREGEFYGTDQRLYMIPVLQELVSKLPQYAQIFDVGAGGGDVVDFALKNAPSGTIINIEEPNPLLLKAYKQKIKKYPHLKLGFADEITLQAYYQSNSVKVAQNSQSLILALHMIYHLTDFTHVNIDPEKDLVNAISFLYGILAPGASLFIVYADLLENEQGEAVCSLAEKYFRTHYPKNHYAENLRSIYQARNNLLGSDGTICNFLKKYYPKTQPKLTSVRASSHFFGETEADIAVLALATELCPPNSEVFDLSKLKFCLEYVSKNPKRIGLQREQSNISQKGLWRANEPQVMVTITRTE